MDATHSKTDQRGIRKKHGAYPLGNVVEDVTVLAHLNTLTVIRWPPQPVCLDIVLVRCDISMALNGRPKVFFATFLMYCIVGAM